MRIMNIQKPLVRTSETVSLAPGAMTLMTNPTRILGVSTNQKKERINLSNLFST